MNPSIGESQPQDRLLTATLPYRRCPVIYCPLCLPIRTKHEPKTKRLTRFSFPQGLGPYNVSKTALLGLGKNLAIELAQSNIRVNCLAPGIIKTNFSRVVRRGCPASCWESWCRGPALPVTPAPLPAFLSPPPCQPPVRTRPVLSPGVRWRLRNSDSIHTVSYLLKWVGMGRPSEVPH